uniref:Uncharacterized protein n=1 Tax=Branchiostoma floridae TaxID=7739 RepID=C3YWP0_BRAFL|eukprot:XP_002599272.1 hypothetical protein BRAFLDRAFT_64379 [Branchiostoma floridae]
MTLALRPPRGPRRRADSIDYSGKGLSELPRHIFRNTEVKRLRLHDNNITELPREINTLVCLERLTLNNNGLNDIIDEVFLLENLRCLDLSDNSLTQLSAAVSNLRELRELHLNKLDLTYLIEDIGWLPKLEVLSVAYNKLTEIPGSISQLKKLKVLILTGNHFDHFPDEVCAVTSLETMSISSQVGESKICFIQDSIGRLRNMKELYLENNTISTLPETIREMKELEVLSCFSNRLEQLPDSLCTLKNLRVLLLQHNRLSKLPDNLDQLLEMNLKELRLDGNPHPCGSKGAGLRQVRDQHKLARLARISSCNASTMDYRYIFRYRLKKWLQQVINFPAKCSIRVPSKATPIETSLSFKLVNPDKCSLTLCKGSREILVSYIVELGPRNYPLRKPVTLAMTHWADPADRSREIVVKINPSRAANVRAPWVEVPTKVAGSLVKARVRQFSHFAVISRLKTDKFRVVSELQGLMNFTESLPFLFRLPVAGSLVKARVRQFSQFAVISRLKTDTFRVAGSLVKARVRQFSQFTDISRLKTNGFRVVSVHGFNEFYRVPPMSSQVAGSLVKARVRQFSQFAVISRLKTDTFRVAGSLVKARVRQFSQFAVISRLKTDKFRVSSSQGADLHSTALHDVTVKVPKRGVVGDADVNLRVKPIVLGEYPQHVYGASPFVEVWRPAADKRTFRLKVAISLPVTRKGDFTPSDADLHLLLHAEGQWTDVTSEVSHKKSEDGKLLLDTKYCGGYMALETADDLDLKDLYDLADAVWEGSQACLILKQNRRDRSHVMITCVPREMASAISRVLDNNGWTGPEPTEPVFLQDGQPVQVTLEGNLKPRGTWPGDRVTIIYNCRHKCHREFFVRPLETEEGYPVAVAMDTEYYVGTAEFSTPLHWKLGEGGDISKGIRALSSLPINLPVAQK